MSSYNLIKQVALDSRHQVTGNTRHFKGGDRVVNISCLQIVTIDGDPGYYLLYFDKDGNELTDTYHETLEGAIEQANWEFKVQPDHWK